MSQKKNQKDFIKQHPIIFKKYKPLKLLESGSCSNIYLGYDTTTQKYVAIKIELQNAPKPLLESESYILFILKGYGIPEILSYGHTKNYKILIETLLGESLLTLYNERKNRFTLYDVCSIAIQALDRIEWVHSKNYIHRDIKPNNFLIGNDDPNVLYLIDFGLAKKYKSDKTGKHILPGVCKKIFGTVRYLSINALRGKESSRRDDIISIGYMLIVFLKGNLPWVDDFGKNKKQNYIDMIYKREKIKPEELCFGLPKQFTDYVKYSYSLKFEQKPNYSYLRSLFITLIEKKYFNYNNYIFSWIDKNYFRNQSAKKSNNSNKIKLGRSESSRKFRLFTKIRKNLQSSENLRRNEGLEKRTSRNIRNSSENLIEKNNIAFTIPKSKNNILELIDIDTNNIRKISTINRREEMPKNLIKLGCNERNKNNRLENLNDFRLNCTNSYTNKNLATCMYNLNLTNSRIFNSKLKTCMSPMYEYKIKKNNFLNFEKLKIKGGLNKNSFTDLNKFSNIINKANIHNNINYNNKNTQNNTTNDCKNNIIIIPKSNNKLKINSVNSYFLQNTILNIRSNSIKDILTSD